MQENDIIIKIKHLVLLEEPADTELQRAFVILLCSLVSAFFILLRGDGNEKDS